MKSKQFIKYLLTILKIIGIIILTHSARRLFSYVIILCGLILSFYIQNAVRYSER